MAVEQFTEGEEKKGSLNHEAIQKDVFHDAMNIIVCESQLWDN